MTATVVGEVSTAPPSLGGLALQAPESVPAGFPSPAQGYYNGPVDLNRHLMRDPTATFIVRVSGDSMTGVGIHDGDELIVDRGLNAHDGSIIIAVLNGELTVKRLTLTGTQTSLTPANPACPEIVLRGDDELVIWGVVTRCIHSV